MRHGVFWGGVGRGESQGAAVERGAELERNEGKCLLCLTTPFQVFTALRIVLGKRISADAVVFCMFSGANQVAERLRATGAFDNVWLAPPVQSRSDRNDGSAFLLNLWRYPREDVGKIAEAISEAISRDYTRFYCSSITK